MKENVTILVNSCDAYEDAWDPFFKIFTDQWEECPFRIVLNTETKKYNCKYCKVETINSGNIAWSNRLKKTLERIDSDLILFFLEDFFLLSKVKEDILFESIELMKSRKEIACISFVQDKGYMQWKTFPYDLDYFEEVDKSSPYRINANVNLWRKDFLLRILRKSESAWEFEENSTIRAKRKRDKVLCIKNEYLPVFDYHLNPKYGYGITRRKWLPNNKELFDQHNIIVDFNKRGFFDLEKWKKEQNKQKRIHRTKKDLILLVLKNPKEIYQILKVKINQLYYKFKAWF